MKLLVAAVLRFATLLAGFAVAVVVFTVPVGLLTGSPVYRSVSIGFPRAVSVHSHKRFTSPGVSFAAGCSQV